MNKTVKQSNETAARHEVTPQMIDAGVAMLSRLYGNVGSAYLVQRVFEAMTSVGQTVEVPQNRV